MEGRGDEGCGEDGRKARKCKEGGGRGGWEGLGEVREGCGAGRRGGREV